jgi:hypothetical protein
MGIDVLATSSFRIEKDDRLNAAPVNRIPTIKAATRYFIFMNVLEINPLSIPNAVEGTQLT